MGRLDCFRSYVSASTVARAATRAQRLWQEQWQPQRILVRFGIRVCFAEFRRLSLLPVAVFFGLAHCSQCQVLPSSWASNSGCWIAPIAVNPATNSQSQVREWFSGTFEELWALMIDEGIQDTVAALSDEGIRLSTSFLLDVFSYIPAAGGSGSSEVQGLLREGVCIRDAEINKSYRILCVFNPGDEF